MSNPKKATEDRDSADITPSIGHVPYEPVKIEVPVEVPAAPAITTKTVKIRNKLNQKVHLNIPDHTGKIVGIEISVGEKRTWTYAGPNLGPDFAVKARKKFVCLG